MAFIYFLIFVLLAWLFSLLTAWQEAGLYKKVKDSLSFLAVYFWVLTLTSLTIGIYELIR